MGTQLTSYVKLSADAITMNVDCARRAALRRWVVLNNILAVYSRVGWKLVRRHDCLGQGFVFYDK